MSKTETTALAVSPVNGYVALAQGIGAMKSVIEENLAGDQVRFAKIKVPAGGGIAWEKPSASGPVSSPDLTGVVVAQRNIKVYYDKPFTGGNEPPTCASSDGIKGVGTPMPGCNAGSFPCAKCPNNQFGTAKRQDGAASKGKACQDKKIIYMILSDRLLPVEVVIPAGSLKPMGEYLNNLSSEGKPLSRIVTKLTLRKEKSGDGITYSQVVPEKVGEITEEHEAALFREYGVYIRELAKKMSVDADYADDMGGDVFSQAGQGE